MAVLVAMLRGVNVGGKNRMKMERLREVFGAVGCAEVCTHIQSGNVVFKTREKKLPALNKKLEDAIAAAFGFRAPLVLRTAEDLRQVVAANPFPGRVESESAKLHVLFLYQDPGEERRAVVRAMPFAPEEVRLTGAEIYVFYPLGAGVSKLRWGHIDKALGTAGTARNWNTVVTLLRMAEGLEG